ncbi:hypothetical protein MAPG_04710, partial [Magnaporthiopsis poae ATCC 64411]
MRKAIQCDGAVLTARSGDPPRLWRPPLPPPQTYLSSVGEITCGPTLILTPANTAIQTWKELTENFSQRRVMISYGNAHEPETAKIVIVSSYYTFAARYSKVATEGVYHNRHRDIRQYDTVVWRRLKGNRMRATPPPAQADSPGGSSGKLPAIDKADLTHNDTYDRRRATDSSKPRSDSTQGLSPDPNTASWLLHYHPHRQPDDRYTWVRRHDLGSGRASKSPRPSCVTLEELEEPDFRKTPDGFKYWLLAPSSMANMSDRGTPDKFSQMLFQATDIFTLRRGMDTMLTLPNGTRVFPRDAVPRSRILNKEIRFGLRHAEVVQETNEIPANIKFVHSDAEDDDPAIPGEDDQTPGPGMSISLIRALTLLASCFNAWRMLPHTSGHLRDMDPAVLASSVQSHLAAKGVNLPSKRQVQKAILGKGMGESAKLGSELVEACTGDIGVQGAHIQVLDLGVPLFLDALSLGRRNL